MRSGRGLGTGAGGPIPASVKVSDKDGSAGLGITGRFGMIGVDERALSVTANSSSSLLVPSTSGNAPGIGAVATFTSISAG